MDFRSKYTYLTSFVIFGLIQLYIIVLSFYLVFRAFSGGTADLKDSTGNYTISAFFSSNTGVGHTLNFYSQNIS